MHHQIINIKDHCSFYSSDSFQSHDSKLIVKVGALFFLEKEDVVHDGRTLYERLKEQKDKKQEEFEEQLKFSKPTVLMLDL